MGFLLVLVLAAAAPVSAPESLARDVRALVGIRSSFAPSLAPDGRRVAFLSTITGSPQVWTVSVQGGWPELVTSFDDPVSAVAWSQSGDWLAVQVAPGGGMNQQVWRIRPDGSSAERITPGGKETNQLLGWDHSGRRLLVSSNRRDPSVTDIYVLTAEARSIGEPTYVGRGMNGADDISRDGRKLLVSRLVSRGSNDLLLVDVTTRTETVLTPHQGPGNFEGRLSPDGRTVWLSTDMARDFPAFGRIRLDPDGRPGPIEIVAERSDAVLDSFAVDEQGRHALLVWNVAGRSQLALVDLTSLGESPSARSAVRRGGRGRLLARWQDSGRSRRAGPTAPRTSGSSTARRSGSGS